MQVFPKTHTHKRNVHNECILAPGKNFTLFSTMRGGFSPLAFSLLVNGATILGSGPKTSVNFISFPFMPQILIGTSVRNVFALCPESDHFSAPTLSCPAVTTSPCFKPYPGDEIRTSGGGTPGSVCLKLPGASSAQPGLVYSLPNRHVIYW